MQEFSENLILRKFDVSNTADVDTFINYLESDFDKIDVLINNSGIRRDNVVALMEVDEWDKVLDVNLKGPWYMCKKMIPLFMKNRYGRIVNISSVGGRLGLSGQANYAASKAGQEALTKVIAKEVGKKGITINNVCPGFIETELLGDLSPEMVKEYKKTVPLRRFGKIDEVSHGVLFLASKQASYITGTSLDIAGGL